jgi:hypothetical protein
MKVKVWKLLGLLFIAIFVLTASMSLTPAKGLIGEVKE